MPTHGTFHGPLGRKDNDLLIKLFGENILDFTSETREEDGLDEPNNSTKVTHPLAADGENNYSPSANFKRSWPKDSQETFK